MIIMAIFLTIDFLLTYYGIHIGMIVEANPVHIWAMNLPFFYSFLFRLVIIASVVTPLYILYRKKRESYKRVVIFGSVLNVGILLLHLRWIIVYLQN